MTYQPRSPEGVIAVEIGSSPGVLKRASQIGAVVGLDWPSVAVLMPEGVDRERVLALLRSWEDGMLTGSAEKSKDGE